MVQSGGPLGIHQTMKQENAAVDATLKPGQNLVLVQPMVRQEPLHTPQGFHETLALNGVVVNKLQRQPPRGPALAVPHITRKPNKFLRVAEKLHRLEPFFPQRMGQRILGMGELLPLVQETPRRVQLEQGPKLRAQIKKNGGFQLEEFQGPNRPIKKKGRLGNLIQQLAAQFSQQAQGAHLEQGQQQGRRLERVLNSLTSAERRKTELNQATPKGAISPVAACRCKKSTPSSTF
ncbi:hypothetical protein [Ralstonia solanacearum]|uniref:hypothetical protein n=1 Tax=Ralstonia solanacearum TaxID=305 RepID=UPI002404E13D|nr:hypothetical protein [Ralstonia solanacearum]